MTKVGITGQSGFIGNHILNTLRLYPNDFNVLPFEKSFFDNATKLDAFVKNCDVIKTIVGADFAGIKIGIDNALTQELYL
jgi:hypothetical protein